VPRNSLVIPLGVLVLVVILLRHSVGALAVAQQPPQPQVKVNMLNVCTPSAEEQKEIASALARVPKQPLFGPDFEVDRGRSSLEESPNFLQPGQGVQMSEGPSTAVWVRIRKEFSIQALFSTVQYSFSVDPKNMVETLVFHVRDPKDLMELTIEDSASAVTPPASMLATSTPASRVKLERFGKSSVVLARCSATEAGPAPDQSAYEPLFQNASSIVSNYRALLAAKQTVPEELGRIETGRIKAKPSSKPAPKKPSSGNK
jgi:hypothetical protein